MIFHLGSLSGPSLPLAEQISHKYNQHPNQIMSLDDASQFTKNPTEVLQVVQYKFESDPSIAESACPNSHTQWLHLKRSKGFAVHINKVSHLCHRQKT